jgi:hypothetical protein
MPKVGSPSILATLQNALPNATIDHLHAVSLEGQIALAKDIDATPEGPVRSSMVWFNRTMAVRPELERLRAEISPDDVYPDTEPAKPGAGQYYEYHPRVLQPTYFDPRAVLKKRLSWEYVREQQDGSREL